MSKAKNMSRIIDLDVDIGADAVDYKCVTFLRHVALKLIMLYLQCYSQPGITVQSGDGDAEVGRCSEGALG